MRPGVACSFICVTNSLPARQGIDPTYQPPLPQPFPAQIDALANPGSDIIMPTLWWM